MVAASGRGIGAAFVDEESGEAVDDVEGGGRANDGAAALDLAYEARAGQKPDVMGEGRGWDAAALRKLAHAQAIRASANKGAQHADPLLGAQSRKSLCGVGVGEGEIRGLVVHIFIFLGLSK